MEYCCHTWPGAPSFYLEIVGYVVSKNVPFSTNALLILVITAFFLQKSAFLAKIVPLLKAIV